MQTKIKTRSFGALKMYIFPKIKCNLWLVRVEQAIAGNNEIIRGKSGLHRIECQVTPGGCEPMERATENIPPNYLCNGKVEMVR